MFERFRAIEEADLVFFRDADSRMRERDRWCMAEFEKSDKSLHIIRDHFWHKSRIMGGAWGAKKGAFPRLDWEAWVSARGG